jgi:anhydro-N-acetylmuramic acid kinase
MRILGTMSGTSMDGIDAAVLETDGHVIAGFGASAFRPYTDAERAALVAAQGRWPGAPGVAEAAAVVEAAHAELLAGFGAADAVAFHGQTLAHDPGGRGTHQAGDGARLAALTGRTVVWDFRSADVAAGGEGAPLAPFYHFALAQWLRAEAPMAVLNLGGVANVTWIDPTAAAPERPGALIACDTGPANAPIDDLVRARCGADFDRDGALAGAGRVDRAILDRFQAEPFLRRPAPKSLDRGAFGWLRDAVAPLCVEDAAATLTAICAAGVAAAWPLFPAPPRRLLVAGGGRRNPALMGALADALPVPPEPVEAVGLDGDMLEAQAFAYLAARVLRGLPITAPGTTGVTAPQTGGRVDGPDDSALHPTGPVGASRHMAALDPAERARPGGEGSSSTGLQ